MSLLSQNTVAMALPAYFTFLALLALETLDVSTVSTGSSLPVGSGGPMLHPRLQLFEENRPDLPQTWRNCPLTCGIGLVSAQVQEVSGPNELAAWTSGAHYG